MGGGSILAADAGQDWCVAAGPATVQSLSMLDDPCTFWLGSQFAATFDAGQPWYLAAGAATVQSLPIPSPAPPPLLFLPADN